MKITEMDVYPYKDKYSVCITRNLGSRFYFPGKYSWKRIEKIIRSTNNISVFLSGTGQPTLFVRFPNNRN